MITFLYLQKYECNESCKYAKNIENPHYKFIPMVPPHALRRQRQPRHGRDQHQRRGVRDDAFSIRRRVASEQSPRGGAVENKDLFQSLDDPVALLEKLHIY